MQSRQENRNRILPEDVTLFVEEKLPTIKYQAKAKKVIEELEIPKDEAQVDDETIQEQMHCGICLVEFEDGEELKALNCVVDTPTDEGAEGNVKV